MLYYVLLTRSFSHPAPGADAAPSCGQWFGPRSSSREFTRRTKSQEPLERDGSLPLDARERRCAYIEGAATSIFRTLAGTAFLVPFALALGAGPLHIGLMGAAPFIGRLLQLGLSAWAQGAGARAAAIRAGLAERLTVAVLASIPFWLADSAAAPWVLVVTLCISATCGEAYTVSSSVWYAERVAPTTLGRFVAARTRWASWSGFVVSLAAGFAADQIARGAPGAQLGGVAATILSGCILGVAGVGVAARIRRLPDPVRIAGPAGIVQDIRDALQDQRFRRFLRYSLVWGFAVNLCAPFFYAYAVRELGFTVLGTAALAATGLAAGAVFLPFWGRVADRYGSRPVMIGCGFWAALVPALWIVLAGDATPYAVFGAEMVAGCVWAGINLAAPNALLKLTPPSRRVGRVAAFTAITGAAVALAPVTGGALLALLEPVLGTDTAFKALFALSCVLRLAALSLLRATPEAGAETLANSVRVLKRARPAWGTPAAVGTALLWVPIAVEAVRSRTERTLVRATTSRYSGRVPPTAGSPLLAPPRSRITAPVESGR